MGNIIRRVVVADGDLGGGRRGKNYRGQGQESNEELHGGQKLRIAG